MTLNDPEWPQNGETAGSHQWLAPPSAYRHCERAGGGPLQPAAAPSPEPPSPRASRRKRLFKKTLVRQTRKNSYCDASLCSLSLSPVLRVAILPLCHCCNKMHSGGRCSSRSDGRQSSSTCKCSTSLDTPYARPTATASAHATDTKVRWHCRDYSCLGLSIQALPCAQRSQTEADHRPKTTPFVLSCDATVVSSVSHASPHSGHGQVTSTRSCPALLSVRVYTRVHTVRFSAAQKHRTSASVMLQLSTRSNGHSASPPATKQP